MRDYLPYTDAELAVWLTNFNHKIATHASVFGINAEDATDLDTHYNTILQAIYEVAAKKEELAKAVAHKNSALTKGLTLLRKEIVRIKAHRNYTEAIGQELGIIGTATSFNATKYKPALKVVVAGGMVRIKFQKKGVDGINIYYRRKGEVVWRFLARDTRSPYEYRIKLEDPSQPEHWEYRAFGVVKDVEIGQPSDVVEVIFGE
jgi:hypothetical protein